MTYTFRVCGRWKEIGGYLLTVCTSNNWKCSLPSARLKFFSWGIDTETRLFGAIPSSNGEFWHTNDVQGEYTLLVDWACNDFNQILRVQIFKNWHQGLFNANSVHPSTIDGTEHSQASLNGLWTFPFKIIIIYHGSHHIVTQIQK